MVTKRWTAHQQMIDREQWARLEERAIAEVEKFETVHNLFENGVSVEIIASSLSMQISDVIELTRNNTDK